MTTKIQTSMTSFDSGSMGYRNKIINGNFTVNQRAYVSGAAVGAGLYGHDRWKMAGSSDTYTFSTSGGVTTVTIPAGKVLQQVIEGLNLITGTYVLSWTGTAQGKIGAGSYGASGVTGSVTGGSNLTIEFGPGTVGLVQLELGAVATPFEHRFYGHELALCQRYYQDYTSSLLYVYGTGYSTSLGINQTFPLPVVMRIAPTITKSSVNDGGSASTLSTTATPGWIRVEVQPTSPPAASAIRYMEWKMTLSSEL